MRFAELVGRLSPKPSALGCPPKPPKRQAVPDKDGGQSDTASILCIAFFWMLGRGL